jgi:opacity protein-like surface antigen
VLFLVTQPAWAETLLVTAERVDLRADASTNSRIIAPVDKGTVLEVLRREGEWFRVSTPGSGYAAYIHGAACEAAPGARPSAAAARVMAPPSASAAAPVAAPRPAPVAQAPAPATSPAADPSPSGGSDEKRAHFGVHGSYATDDIDFGVGGRFALNIPSVRGLGALATFDYFFGNGASGNVGGVEVNTGASAIQVGAFATYTFASENAKPYVGAGLSYFRISVDASASAGGMSFSVDASGSETSLGLVGGVKFADRFFAEGRYHLGDASHLTLSAGILF